jgi:hypothetical protein
MVTSGKITRHCTFEKGSAGLLPAFCDYGLGTDGLDFLAEVRRLPKEVKVPGKNRNAYYIQSVNRPDDIFMYLKGVLSEADGLVPDKEYKLSFQIDFASNSRNCPGVGGSEDSVWLKAGGSTLEPVPVLRQPKDYLTINVDKGHQQEGGKNLGLIGSIWNGQECAEKPRYILLRRDYEHPFPIRSSRSGAQLWFAVGTESGYESLTGVYYYSIKVTAKAV